MQAGWWSRRCAATRRRSPPWRPTASTPATGSPTASCATRTAPRTPPSRRCSGLAGPAHAPRPRAFRRLAAPPRRPRLLRRGPDRAPLGGEGAGHLHRHLARTGRGALRRRPGRARGRLPPADTGAAGGRRPAPPPGVSAHGDRGDPGDPRRDRAVPLHYAVRQLRAVLDHDGRSLATSEERPA